MCIGFDVTWFLATVFVVPTCLTDSQPFRSVNSLCHLAFSELCYCALPWRRSLPTSQEWILGIKNNGTGIFCILLVPLWATIPCGSFDLIGRTTTPLGLGFLVTGGVCHLNSGAIIGLFYDIDSFSWQASSLDCWTSHEQNWAPLCCLHWTLDANMIHDTMDCAEACSCFIVNCDFNETHTFGYKGSLWSRLIRLHFLSCRISQSYQYWLQGENLRIKFQGRAPMGSSVLFRLHWLSYVFSYLATAVNIQKRASTLATLLI